MDPVIYFDAAAADYGRRSSGGLWALVREIEREAVCALLRPRRGERVIDAGCGAGFYGNLLRQKQCEVLGVDAAASMIEAASAAGLPAVHARIEDAALDRESADAVVCAGALEFSDDLAPIFGAFARWLRPGGRAVLLYPAGILSRGYQLYHFLHDVRLTLHCESDIARAAQAAGFGVARTRGAGPLARCMEIVR